MLARKGEAKGSWDASYVVFLDLVSITNVDFSIIHYVAHLCFMNFLYVLYFLILKKALSTGEYEVKCKLSQPRVLPLSNL